MKVKQYTVIFSRDPWLLARLSTDLMMAGCKYWPKTLKWHPFLDGHKWLCLYDDGTFIFLNHNGCGNPLRLTLTSRNYNKTLGKVVG